MRHIRVATIIVLSLFTFLCVGYANSQPGTEQVFESQGYTNLILGSCQLRVKTMGSQVAFIPASASGTMFLATMPTPAQVDLPMDIPWAHDLNGGTVRESLHIVFTLNNGVVQPVEFDLTRTYERDEDKIQRIQTSCRDMKQVGI